MLSLKIKINYKSIQGTKYFGLILIQIRKRIRYMFILKKDCKVWTRTIDERLLNHSCIIKSYFSTVDLANAHGIWYRERLTD